MNLHGIAAPYVGSVNPMVPVTVRISTGPSATQPDGTRNPTYGTPGAVTASIADDVLTVSAVSQGSPGAGDALSGSWTPNGVEIVRQLTGDAGGPGTYLLTRIFADPVAEEAMTTELILSAQVQPITWRDLQQLEGLNLSGTRRKIYLYGSVDSVNRVNRKGGDLVTIANGGVDDGVWMVAQVLEQFPDWVSCAATQQNGA